MQIAVCGREGEKMVMDRRSHAVAANILMKLLCNCIFFVSGVGGGSIFFICACARFIFTHTNAQLPVWFGRCSNEPGFIFLSFNWTSSVCQLVCIIIPQK